MSWLPWDMQHTFAGLWPIIWHWGTPVAIIILCGLGEIALAWFGSAIPYIGENMVKPFQTALCAIAIGAGLFLWGLGDGIKIEKARGAAQQAVIMRQVGAVVDDVVNDPRNQPEKVQPAKKGQVVVPRKAPFDEWDSPEN